MSTSAYEWGGIQQPPGDSVAPMESPAATSWLALGPWQAGGAVFLLLALMRPPMVQSRDDEDGALSWTRLFLWVVASIFLVWVGPIILSAL